MLNVVLYAPEIAMNTGNIGRTCSVTGSRLHLIHPLGFVIDDRKLARAGMDYWHDLDVSFYENFETFKRRNNNPRVYMVETGAARTYSDIRFAPGDFIMFGSESAGIPREILDAYADTALRIPMRKGSRSLNLASSAAVVIFEALRQHDFTGLS
ncbi:MAG: tRNA (cytidine(34)-2'-O)-methyltransferase [Defluviitaleaceae bacterium]|nr:tRNA (cytidine(34)-2'-O)-methyltransferase [Defluviitaleaceae bacterium]